MDSINSRVIRFIDVKGLSKSEFASAIDVSPSIISHVYSGRNKVGIDMLQKFLSAFTDVSPEWLIRGEGEMFKGSQTQKIHEIKAEITLLEDRFKELDASLKVAQRQLNKVSDLLNPS